MNIKEVPRKGKVDYILYPGETKRDVDDALFFALCVVAPIIVGLIIKAVAR